MLCKMMNLLWSIAVIFALCSITSTPANAFAIARVKSTISAIPTLLQMVNNPTTNDGIVASAATFASQKATLTSETTWQLRIALRNVATVQGQRLDNLLFVVTGQFIEEDGYEPPQGYFQQTIRRETDTGSGSDEKTSSSAKPQQSQAQPLLQIVKSRWQLSEDPNDRKDGLWVWGLFKEPLYPFLLLQLETDTITGTFLPNGDAIAPLQLYAQINHQRVDTMGAVLNSPTDIKIRQLETIKADPFGVSQVDVYEEVSIGSLSLSPI